MREYLFLIHGTGYPDEESQEVLQQHIDRYTAWVEKLTASGQYVKGARLENSGQALVDKGERIISDGPYLESKEIVGGYVLIRAKDIEEATALAKECPLSNDFVISIRSMYNWPVGLKYELYTEIGS